MNHLEDVEYLKQSTEHITFTQKFFGNKTSSHFTGNFVLLTPKMKSSSLKSLYILAAVTLFHVVHARDSSTIQPVEQVKNIISTTEESVRDVSTTIIPSVTTLTSGEETEDITIEVIPPTTESYKTLKRDKRMLFGLHWAFKAPFLLIHHFSKKIVGFGVGLMQGLRPGIIG